MGIGLGRLVTCRHRLLVSRRRAMADLHIPVPGVSSRAVMPPNNTAHILGQMKQPSASVRLSTDEVQCRAGAEDFMHIKSKHIGRLFMNSKRRSIIFDDYPDVVNVEQMCSMLGGIGKKTAYDLLKNGEIRYIKLGKSFKIPKACIIDYLVGETQKVSP